jgi:protein O-GlcNAc transferase
VTGVDLRAALARSLEHHQTGRVVQAEAGYRAVLACSPRQPDALHLLAVLTLQRGSIAEGTRLARQATDAAPGQPTFWNTLGMARQAAGQLAEAAAALVWATTLAPEYAEAWANLAAVQQARGDRQAEAAALTRLTALLPGHAPAWSRRGVLAYLGGQLHEAAGHFQQVARLAPEDADAWSNLGAAQVQLGRLTEAETSLQQAVALRPESVDALGNLGAVLVGLARWHDAAAVLERLTALAADRAGGWLNLGHARNGLKQYGEAAAAFGRALALQPDSVAALRGLGDALLQQGEPLRAIACYERALAGSPRDPDAYEHLDLAIQQLGRPADGDAGRSTVADDLQRLVTVLTRVLADGPDRPQTTSYAIVALDVTAGAEAEAQALRARWNARFGGAAWQAAHGPRPPHTNRRDPDRPLRVGYVSADFRHHSAASVILPVLRAHDRSQVTVVCYSGVTAPDAITEQCRGLADLWRETAHRSDDDLAALIRRDEIDILVDLSGHTRANRLTVFAREPAPVQVTAWGYAMGTGLDTMHYFLADEVVVPPAMAHRYTETVVPLPAVVCYEPPAGAPAVAPPPSAARGYVTFGAFNRLTKITPDTISAWGRVLLAVPDARLVVKSGGLEDGPDRELLLGRLARLGVDARRVTILGGTPQPEHLAAHAEIDVLLDTFPHGGGVTTLDALYMGVPTVTLLGERVAGRLSASFLTVLGLERLIAGSVDEYVETAQEVAARPAWLAEERTTLRARLLASPLCDAQAYTRAVEAAYRGMWRRWCGGLTTQPVGSPLRSAPA